ncbi:Cytochrome P450 [Quillaja saponaria]|uniref:Cytochrome P450 n=1 Tax=Quillaja saponaria TaxID=32244 RepID=A0AAD7PT04_QUISA|nr:Cytochrome P450 [Quillaja saponaria]
MVLSLLLLIVSLAIFGLFFHCRRHETHRPPGPPGLPLLGNLHQFDKSAPHLHRWQLSKQYGSLMFLSFGTVPTLVVSSAKMAKEVLENHDLEVSSRPSLVGRQKMSYNGLDVAFTPYVVKEKLRLYPPSPLLVPREVTERCNIAGYIIEPKTLVFINAWAIGRDTEAWENPEEFNPQRFLSSFIDFKGQDFELIPFCAGRRSCPGIHMGALNVELPLTNLLYTFDWELPHGMKREDIDTDIKPGITTHKKNELCLMAKNLVL